MQIIKNFFSFINLPQIKIYSNSSYTAGLVGQAQGYISDSWSSVNVISDMTYLGGITSYVRQSADAVERSLYLGNLYSSSTDQYMHRILGNYVSPASNYAMSSNLINGLISKESNGETILDYNDYLNEDTYRTIFEGDAFDYSQVSSGILPKLYDKDGKTLLPNQRDNYIYKNLFNVNKLVMDKHANSVTVTLYLDNPDNYVLTNVVVDDASVEIKRNDVVCSNFNYKIAKTISDITDEDPFGKVSSIMYIWFKSILKENTKVEINISFVDVNVNEGGEIK